MVIDFPTYNFVQDPEKYKNDTQLIKESFKDVRNGITTTGIVPGIQCYLNYMNLLLSVRNKWNSNGYLDLGMIPIVVGPSFLHQILLTKLQVSIADSGLKIHSMPSTSFLLSSSDMQFEDYWAFRSDVANFLETSPDKVTLKAVLEKLTGGEFE